VKIKAIVRQIEDGSYIAEIAGIPLILGGEVIEGDTMEELVENIQDQAERIIVAYQDLKAEELFIIEHMPGGEVTDWKVIEVEVD